jgi:hypothetical protein
MFFDFVRNLPGETMVERSKALNLGNFLTSEYTFDAQWINAKTHRL